MKSKVTGLRDLIKLTPWSVCERQVAKTVDTSNWFAVNASTYQLVENSIWVRVGDSIHQSVWGFVEG